MAVKTTSNRAQRDENPEPPKQTKPAHRQFCWTRVPGIDRDLRQYHAEHNPPLLVRNRRCPSTVRASRVLTPHPCAVQADSSYRTHRRPKTSATQTRASRQRTEPIHSGGCAQCGRGAELTVDTLTRALGAAQRPTRKGRKAAQAVANQAHQHRRIQAISLYRGLRAGHRTRILTLRGRDWRRGKSLRAPQLL